MTTPPSIDYATPKRRRPFPLWLLTGLTFWAAAIITAIFERAICIYGPLHKSKIYIGPDISFIADSVAILVMFTLAAMAIIILTHIICALGRKLEVRSSYLFWFAVGICFALACTLPETLDTLLSSHIRTEGGNLATAGWGQTLCIIFYFSLPPIISLLSLRRRPIASTR